MDLNFRLCPLRDGMHFHRPTMTFGMRWHGTRHGVAWRGCPDSKIAQNKHCLASPHLAHASGVTLYGGGFPRGFPIASSPLPPKSGKSHKHPPTLPFPRPLALGQPFVSSRNTVLMGLSPRSAKLQVTSLPHFPSPRSPSRLRLFRFVTKHPLTLVHPDPPRELPLPCHRVPSPVP